MRSIKRIFVHCTAGYQTQTVAQLQAEFKARGWQYPGYHYVVAPDGGVHQLLPVEEVSNGVRGYNSTAVNVAYIGGIEVRDGKVIPVDNRTDEQKLSLRSLLAQLKKKFPGARIMGHRSVWGESTPERWLKTCPNFNALAEYADIK